MNLHPSLVPRVIDGARQGRLILTPNEAEQVYGYLVESPRAAVALGLGQVVEIREVPLTILDPVDFLSELDPDDEWTKAHLASYLEGLLEADDLERLLP